MCCAIVQCNKFEEKLAKWIPLVLLRRTAGRPPGGRSAPRLVGKKCIGGRAAPRLVRKESTGGRAASAEKLPGGDRVRRNFRTSAFLPRRLRFGF